MIARHGRRPRDIADQSPKVDNAIATLTSARVHRRTHGRALFAVTINQDCYTARRAGGGTQACNALRPINWQPWVKASCLAARVNS